jgi:adenylylsulfate kinase
MRKLINEIVDKEFYSEIYVNAPLLVCEQRDIKGMYKKARGGEIQNFTGISSPFEPPASPDVIIRTDQLSIDSSVEQILSFVKSKITE